MNRLQELRQICRKEGSEVFRKHTTDVAAWVLGLRPHLREYPPDPFTYIGEKGIGVLIYIGDVDVHAGNSNVFTQFAVDGSCKFQNGTAYLIPWDNFNELAALLIQEGGVAAWLAS